MSIILNDVHSRLNPTQVDRVETPHCDEGVINVLQRSRAEGRRVCVVGRKHAMGGQQFAENAVALDTSGLIGPCELDQDRGRLTIGAGACWTEAVAATRANDDARMQWAIVQKQTGADDLSLGGALAANVHGRGLNMPPIIGDVESFRIITPELATLDCSRASHGDLFALAIGGYGLFGVITRVSLRLTRRRRVRRLVDIIDIDDALAAVHRRLEQGCIYGDFQYAIDPRDDSFLRRGVMACYQEVDGDTPVSETAFGLDRDRWLGLLELAHTDKARAFEVYSQHYLRTHGQVYWSDTMQLSTYVPSYCEFMAQRRPPGARDESLMITELSVPPDRLLAFLRAARCALRRRGVEDIYGTIRSIRADHESFLPWAPKDLACVIFNLRTTHFPRGIARTRAAARDLIDAAICEGGSFYLTYHRWATREQILAAHPRLPAMLAEKDRRDPRWLISSTWHESIRRTLAMRRSAAA